VCPRIACRTLLASSTQGAGARPSSARPTGPLAHGRNAIRMNESPAPDGVLQVDHGGRWGEDVLLPDTTEGRRLITRVERLPTWHRVGRQVAAVFGVLLGAAVGLLNNLVVGPPASTAQWVVWVLTAVAGAVVGWWIAVGVARVVGEYHEANL